MRIKRLPSAVAILIVGLGLLLTSRCISPDKAYAGSPESQPGVTPITTPVSLPVTPAPVTPAPVTPTPISGGGDGAVYVVALADGTAPIPVELYVAGTKYGMQISAPNAFGEQQATFIIWPRNETWNISMVPLLPIGYDPQQWRITVREGTTSMQVKYGDRPVVRLQLVPR